jgi:hypothetical protein
VRSARTGVAVIRMTPSTLAHIAVAESGIVSTTPQQS